MARSEGVIENSIPQSMTHRHSSVPTGLVQFGILPTVETPAILRMSLRDKSLVELVGFPKGIRAWPGAAGIEGAKARKAKWVE